jgi:hypothetical protein
MIQKPTSQYIPTTHKRIVCQEEQQKCYSQNIAKRYYDKEYEIEKSTPKSDKQLQNKGEASVSRLSHAQSF